MVEVSCQGIVSPEAENDKDVSMGYVGEVCVGVSPSRGHRPEPIDLSACIDSASDSQQDPDTSNNAGSNQTDVAEQASEQRVSPARKLIGRVKQALEEALDVLSPKVKQALEQALDVLSPKMSSSNQKTGVADQKASPQRRMRASVGRLFGQSIHEDVSLSFDQVLKTQKNHRFSDAQKYHKTRFKRGHSVKERTSSDILLEPQEGAKRSCFTPNSSGLKGFFRKTALPQFEFKGIDSEAAKTPKVTKDAKIVTRARKDAMSCEVRRSVRGTSMSDQHFLRQHFRQASSGHRQAVLSGHVQAASSETAMLVETAAAAFELADSDGQSNRRM
jgi:hypothetical protein